MTKFFHIGSRLSILVIRALLTSVLAMRVCMPMLASSRPPHSDAKPASKPAKSEESDAQVRRDIQAVYDRQSAALSRKDVEGFLALCTRDYKDIRSGKRVEEAGMMRQTLPPLLAKYPPFTMTAVLKTFQRKGNQATATAVRHVEVMRHDVKTNKQVPWSSDTTTRDVWIKTDKGWLTKRSEEIAFKKKADKRP